MSIDNEYIEKRKEKIRLLRQLGLDPFSNQFNRTNDVKDILVKYKDINPESFQPDNLSLIHI